MIQKTRIYLTKLTDRIKHNSFVMSIFTLSAGVIFSQGIALIAMPLISRIYLPEVIGDFSVLSSNASIIGVLVCLGLMSAIMIPENNDEAKRICRLLFIIIVLLTTIILLFLFGFSGIHHIFEVNLEYRIACLVLYTYIILLNLSSILYAYINRQKKYKVLFWNPTLGTITNAIVSIVLGLLNCGLWGYALGNILALVVVSVHMLRNENPFIGGTGVGLQPISLLKKYKSFPLVLLPSNIIGSVSIQIPVLLLSQYWGNSFLGSYAMSLTVLGLPSKFLSGPINRVFYREASERARNGENIGEFSFRILKWSLLFGMIPISLIVLFGSKIFSFFLGKSWAEAGIIASYLGIYQLIGFLNSCLTGKFVIINRKKTILILNIFGVILFSTIFTICHIMKLDAIMTIAIYSVLGTLFELTDTIIFMNACKVSMSRFLKFLGIFLVGPFLGLLILKFLFF